MKNKTKSKSKQRKSDQKSHRLLVKDIQKYSEEEPIPEPKQRLDNLNLKGAGHKRAHTSVKFAENDQTSSTNGTLQSSANI